MQICVPFLASLFSEVHRRPGFLTLLSADYSMQPHERQMYKREYFVRKLPVFHDLKMMIIYRTVSL